MRRLCLSTNKMNLFQSTLCIKSDKKAFYTYLKTVGFMVGWVAGCMYVLTDSPLYGCPVFQTPTCPTCQPGGLLDVQPLIWVKVKDGGRFCLHLFTGKNFLIR